MPKGQPPSKRMDARLGRIESEIDRFSGSDLPYPTFGDEDKPSLMDRASARVIRDATTMRRNQLEEMNAEGLAKRRTIRDKIHDNREDVTMYSSTTKKFREGGMVRGCNGVQTSGKGFSGTF